MAFDLAQAVRAAPAGGVVSVPAGTYAANLLLDKPLSLVGMGPVVLDGQRRGPVLRVRTPGTVKLAGLLLVGGRTTEAGGGVALEAGELEMLQCTLRFNEAPAFGGGGLAVRGGVARVDQCRFEANTGRQGAAVLVDRDGRLTLRNSLLVQNAAFAGGGLCAQEAAQAELFACTLADNKVLGEAPAGGAVALFGTASRAPKVSLSHCIVSERQRGPAVLYNFERHPGALAVTRCLLPRWAEGLGGDNRFGDPQYVGEGAEPYLLTAGSPAVEAGRLADFEERARDALGRDRRHGDRAPDLGAFSLR